MKQTYEYAVIQLADRSRDERLNAAIAIFSADGLDVRLPRRLEKLRSLSAALDIESVRINLENLSELDKLIVDEGAAAAKRIKNLKLFTSLEFSEVSSFVAISTASYEQWADKLLKELVEPEPARMKVIAKRTRLLSVMKAALRAERILARRDEDISSHRIIPNFRIEEGLSADFALRNGMMHVINTVDASDPESSTRKIVGDIAVSALVVEQARMKFGAAQTKSKLVYDASTETERLARPSLDAAEHQGTELVNWASAEDRRSLIDGLARLATPLERKSSRGVENLNASTQRKLDLN